MTIDLSSDEIGPVDVAVIRFDGNAFDGNLAPALAELHESGTVRIVDLAFVRKETDGSATILEVGDDQIAAAFENVTGTRFDLLNDEDLDEIAVGLEPGSSALVVVWENTWAARFAAAVRSAQGTVVALERIPRDSVLAAVLASLVLAAPWAAAGGGSLRESLSASTRLTRGRAPSTAGLTAAIALVVAIGPVVGTVLLLGTNLPRAASWLVSAALMAVASVWGGVVLALGLYSAEAAHPHPSTATRGETASAKGVIT
jgi:Family of unknown function (DUF6325)